MDHSRKQPVHGRCTEEILSTRPPLNNSSTYGFVISLELPPEDELELEPALEVLEELCPYGHFQQYPVELPWQV